MDSNMGFLEKFLGHMNNLGLQISKEGAVFFLIIVFVLIIFLILLIFRRLRLWYWKVDIQTDKLECIDNRLKNIEEGLTFPPMNEDDQRKGRMIEEDGLEEITGQAENEDDKTEPSDTYYVGKSGKIYTEEELESQIRE